MAREKQYVFSARTTEAGLRILNELKASLKVGWDELVVEAVCEKHNLDKGILTLPKAERPKKGQKPKAGKKKKAKAKARAAGEPEAAPEPTTEAEAPEQALVS
ncbi:MAG TPA: hypothetical protein G4O12_07135 [Dehalococcoidia bacterium]|nr:hypothetical protein [Dehalococcoidia bacterium]